MMKASKKEKIISILLCLVPVVLGLIMWNDLPDMLPTHYGLNGEPDGFSSKLFAVVGIPCIMAALDVLYLFVLSSDPKADGHSQALSRIMLWFTPGLSCIVVPMCLFAALGKSVNVALIVQLLLGVLFIVIGNYLPKCRQNYTMGIRVRWTLDDEDNWNYTHRLGGFVYVIAGFVEILNTFFGSPIVMIAVIIAAVIIPLTASYIYYRKHM